MPIYACYRGPGVNLAMQAPGAFALRVVAGQDWLCFREVATSTLPALESAFARNARLVAPQMEGNHVRVLSAGHPEQLRHLLTVERTVPADADWHTLYEPAATQEAAAG